MASAFDLPASVRGIIADCGYTSPRDILCKVIRQCHLPVAPTYFLVRLGARAFGRFDPEAAGAARTLEKCRVPVLLIHGEADGFVPCEMSRENYARCAAPKALITVPGLTMDTAIWWTKRAWRRRLSGFSGRRWDKKRDGRMGVRPRFLFLEGVSLSSPRRCRRGR